MKIQALCILAAVFFLCTSALMMPRKHKDFPGGKENGEGANAEFINKKQIREAQAQWRFNLLKDENENYNPAYSVQAVQQANSYRSISRSSGLGLQWQELGPDNMGGRTRAILIDKRDTTNNTFYAGSVAGGLWKSTDGANSWHHLPGFDTWMAISCITQGPAPDYTIYVGTGVGLDGVGDEGTSFASGQYGNGIFKVDANDSAILITPTVMQGNFYNAINNSPWLAVNRIAVNPANGNQIIAAAMAGLYATTNGGVSWVQINFTGSLSSVNDAMFTDAKWTVDGNNVYATYLMGNTGGMIYSNTSASTWLQEGSTNVGFPTGLGRVELGITPAAPNTVYALACSQSECTKGLFKSSNAGHTWINIALADSLFRLVEENIHGSCQGAYDLAIAVSPTDADKVYAGGVNFYTASVSYGPQLIGYLYQESDYHAIIIADNNPDVMLISGDHGVYKSTNAFSSFPFPAFTNQNTGYNSVLNYGIGAGIDGSVIGGAQDNGTYYISFAGDSAGIPQSPLHSGDGFLNAVSQVSPDLYYAAYYYGRLFRSTDHAYSFGSYFDRKIDPLNEIYPTICESVYPYLDAQFCTPYYLGESFNAAGGVKKVTYAATDRTHYGGEVVQLTSATGNYRFDITLSDSVSLDSLISVADPIRSRMFMSTVCGVFLTSEAVSIYTTPKWFKLTDATFNGNAQSFVSTPDGNNLYVATTNGYVYRFSNLNIHADTCVYPLGTTIGCLYPASISSSDITYAAVARNRSIEGIDVDQNDNNHVVVVVAGFSSINQPHVYETHDGGQTWVADTVGLPNMPCYSIVVHDAHTFIMGTEFGIWTWDGSSWHEDDTNLSRVPVYRMVERTLRAGGCPVLYIGTHGRGMWRCTTLTPAGCNTTIETPVSNVKPNAASSLNVFPNPAHNSAKISLSMETSDNVTIRIFNLTGKLCSEKSYTHLPSGTNLFDLDVTGLSIGSYICAATIGNTKTLSNLFVVAK